MANRPGFLTRNAADVGSNFRIAEPDAVDFLLLGNNRYGVVGGCNVSIPVESGTTATISGGSEGNILLVDGSLHFVDDAVVPLVPSTAALDRFDLLVYDGVQRRFLILPGPALRDPVFPDVGENIVVLTAIYVPAGATTINRAWCTDKRIMLQKSFMGSVAADAPLLQNTSANGTIPFAIRGSGKHEWLDVMLGRKSTRTLQLEGALEITLGLTVLGAVSAAGSIASAARVSGVNLLQGEGTPAPSDGENGSIYQRITDGALFVRRSYGWDQAFFNQAPPGEIMSSVLLPDDPYLADEWLPLAGGVYPRAAVGRLWDLPMCASWRNEGAQTMTMPTADNVVLMQAPTGTVGEVVGSMSRTLTKAQLPAHTHFGSGTGGSTGESGAHQHTATIGNGGAHGHSVTDGAHGHTVSDSGHLHGPPFGSSGYIVSHVADTPEEVYVPQTGPNPRGTLYPNTAPATTGISVSGGAHQHTVEPHQGHTHSISFTQSGGHSHDMPPESSVGSSSPVDITPARLIVRQYIKT